MNSKLKYKYFLSVFFLFVCSCYAYSQEAKFNISPYVIGVASAENGFIELGPLFYNSKMELIPTIKIPITDKNGALAQIDRNTEQIKIGLAYTYIRDVTKESGPIRRLNVNARLDWGTNKFTFYPDSIETSKAELRKGSFSCLFKIGWYLTKGEINAKQFAPEIRLKYSHNYESAEEIGIVLNSGNSISTVKNLITASPEVNPLLSPAIALSFYPGEGDFSYTPALYFNMIGKEGGNNPFDKSSRARMEFWFFYYPKISKTANVKLGISPFISLRVKGSDSLNSFEYGGLIQLAVDTNMLRFFN